MIETTIISIIFAIFGLMIGFVLGFSEGFYTGYNWQKEDLQDNKKVGKQ